MKKLIAFELKKLFSRRLTQIALLLLLLFSALINISSYQNKYAFDGKQKEGSGKTAVEIDKEIAEKYEGILTDEKVRQMMSDFAPTVDLHGMNAAYLYQNATQSAVFARFSDMNGNWNGRSVSDVFGKEKIKIGYVDGWLSTAQNMAQIFLVLALVLVVMTAPVFCGEYGGVDNLIFTSKYGKTKGATAKAAASILASLIVTGVIILLNYLLAFLFYGSSGLDCSILFAPIGYTQEYIPFNITCGTLVKYQILLAFTGVMGITGTTLMISALSKSPVIALTASAAAFAFPVILPVSEASPLFRYIALLPLYHVQYLSLMSIEQMGNGMLYAVWAIPGAFILLSIGGFVSPRIFAKHQIL